MHIVFEQREIGLFLQNAIMEFGHIGLSNSIGLLAAGGDACTAGTME